MTKLMSIKYSPDMDLDKAIEGFKGEPFYLILRLSKRSSKSHIYASLTNIYYRKAEKGAKDGAK